MFAFSKEFYIVDHGLSETIIAILIFNTVRLRYGEGLKNWLDKKRKVRLSHTKF